MPLTSWPLMAYLLDFCVRSVENSGVVLQHALLQEKSVADVLSFMLSVFQSSQLPLDYV